MLVKHPKPQLRKWLKRGAFVAFVFEAGAFAATYFGWSKVNTDRGESRLVMLKFPKFLNVAGNFRNFWKLSEIYEILGNFTKKSIL